MKEKCMSECVSERSKILNRVCRKSFSFFFFYVHPTLQDSTCAYDGLLFLPIWIDFLLLYRFAIKHTRARVHMQSYEAEP